MDEVERLIKQLGDSNREMCEQAAAALIRIGTPAVEPLCHALRDKRADVRRQAAMVLGDIGRREALPALKARLFPLIGERDKNVRAAIRAAIEKIEKAMAEMQVIKIQEEIQRAAGEMQRAAEEIRRAAEGLRRMVEGVQSTETLMVEQMQEMAEMREMRKATEMQVEAAERQLQAAEEMRRVVGELRRAMEMQVKAEERRREEEIAAQRHYQEKLAAQQRAEEEERRRKAEEERCREEEMNRLKARKPSLAPSLAWVDIGAGGRGAFDAIADAKRDSVNCTVFAPAEVPVWDFALVQVFVHTPEQAEEARATAQEFDADSQRRGVTALGTQIVRGSRLTFELIMRNLRVHDPVQELIWRGNPDSVRFEVEVPPDTRPQTVIGKVLVSQDTVPIGEVKFKLKVVADKAIANTKSAPSGEARRYQKAFTSYASQDRPEVLRRVQMLPLVGIRFFQDILDLEPGDRWERKLYHYIDESDVLLLFWSTAAKQSEWVEREWRYGLERKGDDFIRPVIIEGPPIVPPPPELAHLHFNDKLLYFITVEDARRQATG